MLFRTCSYLQPGSSRSCWHITANVQSRLKEGQSISQQTRIVRNQRQHRIDILRPATALPANDVTEVPQAVDQVQLAFDAIDYLSYSRNKFALYP